MFFGKTGDWTLAHNNPTKTPPRDIAPWIQPRLLSAVIDSGSYEQKAIVGSLNKIVTIWLYNTPEAPVRPKSFVSPGRSSRPSFVSDVVRLGRRSSRTIVRLGRSFVSHDRSSRPVATPPLKVI